MFQKIALALTAILFISQSSFAQSDEEQIKEIIRDFNKDVAKLMEIGSSRAEKVLSYTHPHFTYESRTVNVMNIVSKDSYNKKMVTFLLNELRASGLTVKRKLGPLNEIYIRENLAVARFELDYELYESERLINKGIQYDEYILRKNSEGKWMIEYMYILNIDDITYKSKCITEIYETKGLSNILTETIVPDGHNADVLEDKFSVDESTAPRLVRHGFRDYLWDVNGTIFKRNVDGTPGDKVGVARSRQEMLITLLQKEVYPDRCTTVIRKLN